MVEKMEKNEGGMAVTIDKSTLTLVALALLIVVVVFQAVQINGIKAQIATGAIVSTGSTTGSVSGSSTGSAGSSAPSSLDSLPSMVGGC